jgi:hypothetical protein
MPWNELFGIHEIGKNGDLMLTAPRQLRDAASPPYRLDWLISDIVRVANEKISLVLKEAW